MGPYGQICALVAVAKLEDVPGHLQICSSYFYQVSEWWSMCLLFKDSLELGLCTLYDYRKRKMIPEVQLVIFMVQ